MAQDPNNADAHVGLGLALAEQHNHEAAIRRVQSGFAVSILRPSGVKYRMGISQAQLKQYDDAIASYLKERDSNGDAAELETALADAYQAKGMAQQAQEARNKAAQLGGGQPDDH